MKKEFTLFNPTNNEKAVILVEKNTDNEYLVETFLNSLREGKMEMASDIFNTLKTFAKKEELNDVSLKEVIAYLTDKNKDGVFVSSNLDGNEIIILREGDNLGITSEQQVDKNLLLKIIVEENILFTLVEDSETIKFIRNEIENIEVEDTKDSMESLMDELADNLMEFISSKCDCSSCDLKDCENRTEEFNDEDDCDEEYGEDYGCRYCEDEGCEECCKDYDQYYDYHEDEEDEEYTFDEVKNYINDNGNAEFINHEGTVRIIGEDGILIVEKDNSEEDIKALTYIQVFNDYEEEVNETVVNIGSRKAYEIMTAKDADYEIIIELPDEANRDIEMVVNKMDTLGSKLEYLYILSEGNIELLDYVMVRDNR